MWDFPYGREEKKKYLLDAVVSVKDIVALGGEESNKLGTLPQETVDALYKAGLFAMKLPREAGGAEADPVTQIEVIEALSYINASVGWCVMIGATAVGWPAAFLPEKGFNIAFGEGVVPKCVTVSLPAGSTELIENTGDGYVVTGRWPYASGARHSEWIGAGIRMPDENSELGWKQMYAFFPTKQATIHDNWDVVGLRGTGSCDVSLDKTFVPSEFIYDVVDSRNLRGGPLYLLGRPGFVINEHAGLALGIARRALDEIVKIAKSKRRRIDPNTIAERSVFQRVVGELDLKLRATRHLCLDVFENAWNTVSTGEVPSHEQQNEMRATSLYATEIALDVVTKAFRYAGGSALHEGQVLQECLRDMNAAAQHFMVTDAAYESHGQTLLDISETLAKV